MRRLSTFAAAGRRVLESGAVRVAPKRPVALRVYYRSEGDELLYIVADQLTRAEADELRARARRSDCAIAAVTPHEEDYPALDRSRRVVLPSQSPTPVEE